MENCFVSVILRTLNQEDSITQTIESILQQITSFDFEIIICDEGSTDGTVDTIKLYLRKYPEKIKLVSEEDINPQGKYIALCSGGDIWVDPNKLQTQFEVIEQHPEIDICVHATTTLSSELRRPIGRKMPFRYNAVIDVERIIANGENFIAEGSVFYRASINENMPEFRKETPSLYSLVLHAALSGGILYISDNMAQCLKNKGANDVEKVNKNIQMLQLFDEYTNKNYTALISGKKLECEFFALKLNKEFKTMKDKKYKPIYKKLSLIEKIKINFAK